MSLHAYTFPADRTRNYLTVSGVSVRSGYPLEANGEISVSSLMSITDQGSSTYDFDWHAKNPFGITAANVTIQIQVFNPGQILKQVVITWGDGNSDTVTSGYGTSDNSVRQFTHVYEGSFTNPPTIQVVGTLYDDSQTGITFALLNTLPTSDNWDVDQVRFLGNRDGDRNSVVMQWADIEAVPTPYTFTSTHEPLVQVQGRRVTDDATIMSAKSACYVSDTKLAASTLNLRTYPTYPATGILSPPFRGDVTDSYGRLVKATASSTLTVDSGTILSGDTATIVNGKFKFPSLDLNGSGDVITTVTTGSISVAKTIHLPAAEDPGFTWTPDDLGVTYYEWRFDDGAGLTLTGTGDANDGTLAGSTNTPTWVTEGLEFDGDDYVDSNTTLTAGLPRTFVFAIQASQTAASKFVLRTTSGFAPRILHDTGTPGNMRISNVITGGSEATFTSMHDATAWHTYAITYDAVSAYEAYVDGASFDSQSIGSVVSEWIIQMGSAASGFIGKMAWLIALPSVVSPENIANIHNYIRENVASRGISLTEA